MEAIIAILIVLGVLSASGVLPETSPPTANQETQASELEISERAVRPTCNPHELVYRDLTTPYRQRTSSDAVGKAETACDD